MKTRSTLLVVCLCALIYIPTFAQVLDHDHDHKDHICVLPATHSEGQKISLPFNKFTKEKSEIRAATITVNYLAAGQTQSGNTCSTWPAAAQTAFTYAANIWGSLLESDQTINVNACWTTDLASTTLGSAGSSGFFGITGAPGPFSDFTAYNRALYEALQNSNTNNSDSDINANFNANRTDWYFGTDASPAFAEYDFVTVVLHELGHGLGFSGAKNIDDGNSANGDECDGITGNGCIGFPSAGYVPTTYSRHVETGNGTDVTTINSSASTDIATLLIGGNVPAYGTGLFHNGPTVTAANSGNRMKLHTPSTYAGGSTYSHFELSSSYSELMEPSLTNGVALHDVGLADELLLDQGWTAPALPVELLSFKGTKDESSVLLNWETTLEINNEGYQIQRSSDGKQWFEIGYVNGTNLADVVSQYSFTDYEPFTGQNYYRLRQIDFDGTASRSKVVSVSVEGTVNTIAVSPNPANDQLNVQWQSTDERMKSVPYQVIGSTGQVLLSGLTTERNQTLDIVDLPAGLYRLVLLNETEPLVTGFVKK